MTTIAIKRIYEDPSPDDGCRIYIDRLWPRGLKRDEAAFDTWCKDVSPSDALRKRFGHDPKKWKSFIKDYEAELSEHPDACGPLLDAAKRGKLTLLYSAKDEEHNNAVVLREYLERRLAKPA